MFARSLPLSLTCIRPSLVALHSKHRLWPYVFPLDTSWKMKPCTGNRHTSSGGSVLTKRPLQVLCLDGGGVRGVILIEILKVIEKKIEQRTGRREPIHKYFDVIGGTSTGGIVALGLAMDFELETLSEIYRSMVTKVFSGQKLPYDEQPLENLLKEKFGSNTTLSDVYPPSHVIITSVQENCNPPELTLLTNYPGETTDFLIWKAARATSAARGFFKALDDKYVDGGLMANNPTLDVLAKIHERESPERVKGGILVSLGTGELIPTSRHIVDIEVPNNLFDLINTIRHRHDIAHEFLTLIAAVLSRGGHIVTRANAWCSMIGMKYHRIEPLVAQQIRLDCKDLKEVDLLIEHTRLYLDTKEVSTETDAIADHLVNQCRI